MVYWRHRDYNLDQLLKWLTTAHQLAQETNQKLYQANVRKAIGDVQAFQDDRDAALASYDKALQLFEQVGAKLGQAATLLGFGKLTGEEHYFEEAIAIHSVIHSRYDVGVDKFYYGFSLLQRGEKQRGVILLLESQDLFRQSNFDYGVQLIDDHLAQMNISE